MDEIPVGTYVGSISWTHYEILFGPRARYTSVSGEVVDNEIVISVAEDGTVTGSTYFMFSEDPFSTGCPEGPVETLHDVAVEGTLGGWLSSYRGTIEVAETWFDVYESGCASYEPRRVNIERQLEVEIEVSDGQMTGTTLPSSNGFHRDEDAMWTFTATKQ